MMLNIILRKLPNHNGEISVMFFIGRQIFGLSNRPKIVEPQKVDVFSLCYLLLFTERHNDVHIGDPKGSLNQ